MNIHHQRFQNLQWEYTYALSNTLYNETTTSQGKQTHRRENYVHAFVASNHCTIAMKSVTKFNSSPIKTQFCQ